jgi:hypothetical protein
VLLFAVRFEVVFGSVLGVLRGVKMVSMGNVGVILGCLTGHGLAPFIRFALG